MKFSKYSIFIWSLCGLMLVTKQYFAAESYIMPRPSKTRSAGQLKQDIMQSCANILQQECKIIELQAQIQQELCKRISDLAENNKDAKLVKANKTELQNSFNKLSMIEQKNKQIINHIQETLSFVASGCIEKSIPVSEN